MVIEKQIKKNKEIKSFKSKTKTKNPQKIDTKIY